MISALEAMVGFPVGMEPPCADWQPPAYLEVISHLCETNVPNTLWGCYFLYSGVNPIPLRATQLLFFTARWGYSTLISSLKTKLNSDEHTDLVLILDFLSCKDALSGLS